LPLFRKKRRPFIWLKPGERKAYKRVVDRRPFPIGMRKPYEQVRGLFEEARERVPEKRPEEKPKGIDIERLKRLTGQPPKEQERVRIDIGKLKEAAERPEEKPKGIDIERLKALAERPIEIEVPEERELTEREFIDTLRFYVEHGKPISGWLKAKIREGGYDLDRLMEAAGVPPEEKPAALPLPKPVPAKRITPSEELPEEKIREIREIKLSKNTVYNIFEPYDMKVLYLNLILNKPKEMLQNSQFLRDEIRALAQNGELHEEKANKILSEFDTFKEQIIPIVEEHGKILVDAEKKQEKILSKVDEIETSVKEHERTISELEKRLGQTNPNEMKELGDGLVAAIGDMRKQKEELEALTRELKEKIKGDTVERETEEARRKLEEKITRLEGNYVLLEEAVDKHLDMLSESMEKQRMQLEQSASLLNEMVKKGTYSLEDVQKVSGVVKQLNETEREKEDKENYVKQYSDVIKSMRKGDKLSELETHLNGLSETIKNTSIQLEEAVNRIIESTKPPLTLARRTAEQIGNVLTGLEEDIKPERRVMLETLEHSLGEYDTRIENAERAIEHLNELNKSFDVEDELKDAKKIIENLRDSRNKAEETLRNMKMTYERLDEKKKLLSPEDIQEIERGLNAPIDHVKPDVAIGAIEDYLNKKQREGIKTIERVVTDIRTKGVPEISVSIDELTKAVETLKKAGVPGDEVNEHLERVKGELLSRMQRDTEELKKQVDSRTMKIEEKISEIERDPSAIDEVIKMREEIEGFKDRIDEMVALQKAAEEKGVEVKVSLDEIKQSVEELPNEINQKIKEAVEKQIVLMTKQHEETVNKIDEEMQRLRLDLGVAKTSEDIAEINSRLNEIQTKYSEQLRKISETIEKLKTEPTEEAVGRTLEELNKKQEDIESSINALRAEVSETHSKLSEISDIVRRIESTLSDLPKYELQELPSKMDEINAQIKLLAEKGVSEEKINELRRNLISEMSRRFEEQTNRFASTEEKITRNIEEINETIKNLSERISEEGVSEQINKLVEARRALSEELQNLRRAVDILKEVSGKEIDLGGVDELVRQHEAIKDGISDLVKKQEELGRKIEENETSTEQAIQDAMDKLSSEHNTIISRLTDIDERLDENLTNIKSAVEREETLDTAMIENINKSAEQINRLRYELETVRKSIENIRAIGADTTELERKQNEILRRIDEYKERLEEKVTKGFEEIQDLVNQKINDVNANMDEKYEKFKNLILQLPSNPQLIDEIRGARDDIIKTRNELTTKLDVIQRTIDDLKRNPHFKPPDTSGIGERLRNIEDLIRNEADNVVSSVVEEHKKTREDLERRAEELDKKLEDAINRLKKPGITDEEREELVREIKKIAEDKDKVYKQLSELSEQLSNVSAGLSGLGAKVDALKDEHKKLSDELSQISRATTEITSMLSRLSTRVAEKEDIDVVVRRLEEQGEELTGLREMLETFIKQAEGGMREAYMEDILREDERWRKEVEELEKKEREYEETGKELDELKKAIEEWKREEVGRPPVSDEEIRKEVEKLEEHKKELEEMSKELETFTYGRVRSLVAEGYPEEATSELETLASQGRYNEFLDKYEELVRTAITAKGIIDRVIESVPEHLRGRAIDTITKPEAMATMAPVEIEDLVKKQVELFLRDELNKFYEKNNVSRDLQTYLVALVYALEHSLYQAFDLLHNLAQSQQLRSEEPALHPILFRLSSERS